MLADCVVTVFIEYLLFVLSDICEYGCASIVKAVKHASAIREFVDKRIEIIQNSW